MNNSVDSSSNIQKEPELSADSSITVTDEELVRSSVDGDLKAFTELLKRYQDSVYSLLYNLSQKAELADDLTQQTLIKVWKSLSQFEQRSSFSTWVYRIAHNVFYDFKRKKEPEMVDIDAETFDHSAIDTSKSTVASETAPDEVLIKKERLQMFKKALARLSPEHSSVLILKEVNGLSYKEIAEVSGCSTGTVMSRLHYARQNLRSFLQQDEN